MPKTLVLSDLHLGAGPASDLLRRADLRAPLLRAIDPGDRVVLLGDAVEFRTGPARDALAIAAPALAAIGRAVGGDGEILIVPGNHDHVLVAPWLAQRLDRGEGLGLDQRIGPAEAGPLAAQVAALLAPAPVTYAYPGAFLREDVYALHGHFLDRHITVPTFERLGAGLMTRLYAPLPEAGMTPDDYEAALAPMYAFMESVAQRVAPDRSAAPAGSSVRAWQALSGGHGSRVRGAALALAYIGGVAAVNRLGLGPVERKLSGPALRRAGLLAMREVVGRLGVTTPHVLFGHTHRAGPLPGDDPLKWGPLHNAGSWVYQPHFLTRTPHESPYWPGGVLVLDDGAPPRLERLLGYRGLQDLAPVRAVSPDQA